MKLAKGMSLRTLVVLFTLVAGVILTFSPAFVTPLRAQATRTGQYTGNGGTFTIQVQSGLAVITSLRIVTVPDRGPASEAYTTNTIQLTNGGGTFLNGNRKDSGVQLETGNFVVTSPDFNEAGVIYHWEAHGCC